MSGIWLKELDTLRAEEAQLKEDLDAAIADGNGDREGHISARLVANRQLQTAVVGKIEEVPVILPLVNRPFPLSTEEMSQYFFVAAGAFGAYGAYRQVAQAQFVYRHINVARYAEEDVVRFCQKFGMPGHIDMLTKASVKPLSQLWRSAVMGAGWRSLGSITALAWANALGDRMAKRRRVQAVLQPQ